MRYNERELFLIWLDSFVGFEYKHKAKIFATYKGGRFSDHIAREADYIKQAAGEAIFSSLASADTPQYIDYILSGLDRRGVVCVTLATDIYPEELKEAPCPPLVLYAEGDVGLLKTDKFAIVGSRKSLPFAVAKAEEFTEKLNAAGLTVVTGVAEGAETAILKTGLKTGKVICVLAGGSDNVYPRANTELVKRLKERALVISEYPPETPTERFHFPVRNRIIAGLGRGTLVVSGGAKSGTNYTAEYTEDLSRQVFAFPYSLNVASGEGCNNLIKRGAYLTDCAEDILGYYGYELKENDLPELSEIEKTVYELISEEETHIDKLCALTGKKSYELAPALSMLEIKKLIVKLGGNRYSRV